MKVNDMVFDHNTNPAYIHTPDKVRNWLERRIDQGYPTAGYQVRLGSTLEFVSVREYLSKEQGNE